MLICSLGSITVTDTFRLHREPHLKPQVPPQAAQPARKSSAASFLTGLEEDQACRVGSLCPSSGAPTRRDNGHPGFQAEGRVDVFTARKDTARCPRCGSRGPESGCGDCGWLAGPAPQTCSGERPLPGDQRPLFGSQNSQASSGNGRKRHIQTGGLLSRLTAD